MEWCKKDSSKALVEDRFTRIEALVAIESNKRYRVKFLYIYLIIFYL